MRGRIALFVVLAVVVALVAAYVGWSTNTPKAVADPTATPSDSSVDATEHRAPGSGRSGSSGGAPGIKPPKTPPKTPPKGQPPEACSPEATAKLAAHATQPDEATAKLAAYVTEPEEEPAQSEEEPAQPDQEPAQPDQEPAQPDQEPAQPDQEPAQPDQEPATDAAPTDSAPESVTTDDTLHLGPVTPEGDHEHVSVSVSDDREALTAVFDNLEVQVWQGTECDLTKSFDMTLPVVGTAKGETLKFYVQGYAFASHASARLTIKHHGRRLYVRDFPDGTDESYLANLELPAFPGATYQLSTVIEVHHTPGGKGDAYLNVSAIDANIS
jgi:hypothetical protein